MGNILNHQENSSRMRSIQLVDEQAFSNNVDGFDDMDKYIEDLEKKMDFEE